MMTNKATLFLLSSLICILILNCCKPRDIELASDKGITFRVSGIEEGGTTELIGSTKGRNTENPDRLSIHREIRNVQGLDIDLIIEENAVSKK